MSDNLLAVCDLSVSLHWPGDAVTAAEGVSFNPKPGEVLGIVGESGSDKSQVVFNLMGRLATNATLRGEMRFEGHDLLALPRARDGVRGVTQSMIFQDPDDLLQSQQTGGDQLAEGLRLHDKLGKAAAWRTALRLRYRVRIPVAAMRAARYPNAFSGGVRSRVMIAMALLVARPCCWRTTLMPRWT